MSEKKKGLKTGMATFLGVETTGGKGKLKALKAFKLVQNEYVREIVEGDDLSDVPEKFLENLKTEKVI